MVKNWASCATTEQGFEALLRCQLAGLRSFAAVGEFYELNPCGGWVPIPRAQNSSSRWVGAPATLLKPPVATERLR